jgi:CDGSH-type Zn-finger protein
MMTEPVIAQKAPYEVEVQQGKTYYWCACGKSARQPFCDGSHAGSAFVPIAYKAEKTETAYFCGCKRSGGKPLCDGAHEKL